MKLLISVNDYFISSRFFTNIAHDHMLFYHLIRLAGNMSAINSSHVIHRNSGYKRFNASNEAGHQNDVFSNGTWAIEDVR